MKDQERMRRDPSASRTKTGAGDPGETRRARSGCAREDAIHALCVCDLVQTKLCLTVYVGSF